VVEAADQIDADAARSTLDVLRQAENLGGRGRSPAGAPRTERGTPPIDDHRVVNAAFERSGRWQVGRHHFGDAGSVVS